MLQILLCLEDWGGKEQSRGNRPVFQKIERGGRSIQGGPLSKDTVGSIVKRFVKDEGMDPTLYSAYSLRRGGATALARVTGSLPLVAKLGRWRSLETPMGYIDFNDTDQVVAQRAMCGYSRSQGLSRALGRSPQFMVSGRRHVGRRGSGVGTGRGDFVHTP